MAAPALSHTAARLYAAVEPLAREDASYGYALAHFQAAVAKCLDEPADLSRDQDDGTPGWAVLFQLDAVAPKFLPYVGQFLGVDVPAALDAESAKARIRGTAGFRRGSPGAIIAVAQATLTGTKAVLMTERHGSAYLLTIATRVDETPDPDWTRREVEAQTPGGVIVSCDLLTGTDFASLRDTHLDFSDVKTTFADFAEVRSNPSKT